MNTYGQYCPVAKAVEILGDRWTLLIVRDLLCGTNHFNGLERGLPGIPKAVLTERLKRLQQVGIIERQGGARGTRGSYLLTPAGQELYPIIAAMTQWGAKWAFGEPEQSDLDPTLLLWWMHNRVFHERLPERQVVVEFDFIETRPAHFWLVLKPRDVSVCMTHPGFETDLLVTASLAAMLQVWLGRRAFGDALRADQVVLDGPPALIRDFPDWFALSPVVDILREAKEGLIPSARSLQRP